MQRNLILTEDGSHSIAIPEMEVSYHSVHGAILESMHVFIEAGWRYWWQQHASAGKCVVFEMGFGTGLNALLTLQEAEQQQQPVFYETVEAYPLETALAAQLNYCGAMEQPYLQPLFVSMHTGAWNTSLRITNQFTLHKINTPLSEFENSQPIDIIYYDAFAPRAQAELWTEAVFRKLLAMLAPEGILVTYCSKGNVRRALQAAGFIVEKIPGPPGKREMLRAAKG